MSIYQNINNKKYKELLSLANMYLEDDTSIDLEEIENRIYEAYEDEEITPTQYDHLTGILG